MKRLLLVVAAIAAIAAGCATSSGAAPAPAVNAAPAKAAPPADAERPAPAPIAKGWLLTDPNSDAHRPRVPPNLEQRSRFLMLKMYVSQSGDVTGVDVVKGEEPEVNAEVVAKLKTWRYRPYTVDARPVPFAFIMRLDLNQEVAAPAAPAAKRPAAIMVSPEAGTKQLLVDPAREPYRPRLPSGVSMPTFAIVKVCVSTDGAVTRAQVINPVAPQLRDEIVDTVKTWRYQPYAVNGEPVPFCYVIRLNLP